MDEQILPKVRPDSFLDREVARDNNRNLRLTVMGVLHYIAQEGRPRYIVPVTDQEGHPDVEEVDIPAIAILRDVLRSAIDRQPIQGNESKNPLVRDRIREYTAVVSGFREHIREGGTPNLWQLPLLRFLGFMEYSSIEIRDAVYAMYPPEDLNISPAIKIAFRRAAVELWGIGNTAGSLYGEKDGK